MTRICPLCEEEVDTTSKWPHICKKIPMPTLGQCKKCGTALNELNMSVLFQDLCRSCHTDLPGNRTKALEHFQQRGKVIFVRVRGSEWYIWVYMVTSKRLILDMMRRTYGGYIRRHNPSVFMWKIASRRGIIPIARDLQKPLPRLSASLLDCLLESSSLIRYVKIEAMMEEYKAKTISMNRYTE